MKSSKNSILILVTCLIVTAIDAQSPKDSINYKGDTLVLSEVVLSSQNIFSQDKDFLSVAGASLYFDEKELDKYKYTNINRILEGATGVQLYEESGFGLRPNISIRGTAPERSEKINVMEDGIPISPAPYSASAAYYFPNFARMSGVEILKGSGQIKYGPNTTGGTINLISKKIPTHFNVGTQLSFGRFTSIQNLSYIGDTKGKWGYLVQYMYQTTNGFKKLPNDGSTGFNKNDVLAKLNFSDKWGTVPVNFQLKYQYSDEDGDETYVGITDEDFRVNPYQRYVASSVDKMKNNHHQWALYANIQPLRKLNIDITAYQNTFERNWNKTQSVEANNGNIGLGKIFENPIQYANELAVLKGEYNGDHSIYLRNNNRAYLSKGVQSVLNYAIKGEMLKHEFYFGLKYHFDNADRFQWDDRYQLVGNTIGLVERGQEGSQSNRIDEATAFSSYLQYQIHFKNLWLTTGLRYEDIELRRLNYGDDYARMDAASVRKNDNKVWIPGVSLQYNFDPKWETYAGIHKGFSPSGSVPNQQAEDSWNYEWGLRYNKSLSKLELGTFFNDYDNMLGSDLNAAGGEGNNELLNAGALYVYGIEGSLDTRLTLGKGISLPFTATYTFQTSSFKDSFESDLFGEVQKGDHLPNIPEHQMRLQLGLEKNKWSAYISYRWLSERRTDVGKGPIDEKEKVSAYGVFDASIHYALLSNLQLFATLDNLFNQEYAVSRLPYGLRPGMPFFAKIGMQFRLQ